MKGYIASQYPSPEGTYSDVKVLRSAAGYYIGTIFHHMDGYDEPGSRESGYYPTKELAEKALIHGWEQRMYP